MNRTDVLIHAQTWVFQHPNFYKDGRSELDNIKRKVPNGHSRVITQDSSSDFAASLQHIRLQVDRLSQQQADQIADIRRLEDERDRVIDTMASMHDTLAQRDGLVRDMMQYWGRAEDGEETQ